MSDDTIDLSSGIVLSDEERERHHKALADIEVAFAAAVVRLSPELHPVAQAIHNLRKVLPAAAVAAAALGSPLPVAIIDALAGAAEDAAEALGL